MSTLKIALGVGCGVLLAAGALIFGYTALVGYGAHLGEQESAQAARATPAPPPLLLGEWSWRRRGETWVEIEGEVANVSSSPLPSVQALASYYTQDGSFVASDSAMIEYQPLAPGQTSPFSLTTEWRDGMAVARLAFKRPGGEAIPHADTNEAPP